MIGYVIKRILMVIPVLLGVSIIVFMMLRFIPGDPAVLLAGEDATPEAVQALREEWGLNEPLHVQYFIFIKNLLHGNLGVSIRSGTPVAEEIFNRYPNTVALATTGFIIALSIGLTAGIISGTRPYSLFDNLSMLAALFGVSAPAFWLGLMLMWLFAVKLGWFQAVGVGGIQNLVLPSITLGAVAAGTIARQTRSSVLEVMRQEYIRTARSKGVPEKALVFRHVLKNAILPVVTVASMLYSTMLSGSIIVETVFAYPGLGKLLIDSISSRDYPVVQALVLLYATVFTFINLITDLLYCYLDPRIRYK
jgi:ABC-type dipeptide/oligopeptide/nickel transport system permease component